MGRRTWEEFLADRVGSPDDRCPSAPTSSSSRSLTPPADLVADRADGLDAEAGGIVERPVLVARAREDRAGVAAAHDDHNGDDQAGELARMFAASDTLRRRRTADADRPPDWGVTSGGRAAAEPGGRRFDRWTEPANNCAW